jgi:PKD domain
MRVARAIAAVLASCAASVVPAAGAQAGAWLPPTDLASGSLGFEDVAMTPQGESIAAWRVFDGGQWKIETSVRPPGGVFSAPDELIPLGDIVENLDVAIDPAGNAVITWRKSHGGSDIRLYHSFRPVGGAFTPPDEVMGAGTHVAQPMTAMDPGGNAITVFRRAPGGDDHIAYVVRPAGGAYGSQEEITSYSADSPEVAIAGDGTAIAAWTKGGFGGPIEAARRPGGGSFGAIQTISGENTEFVRLAVGSAGRALLAWSRFDGANTIVEASLAEPGGAFGPPDPLSSPGVNSGTPAPAVSPSNSAFLGWRDGGGGEHLRFAAAPPGAPFGPTAPLPGMGEFPRSAVFADDDSMILLASAGNEAPFQVRAAARSSAGVFSAPATLSKQGESSLANQLAGDGNGNFLALFSRDDGEGNSTLKARGYDGEPPSFIALSVPPRARTGEAVSFSADAIDVWGAPRIEWRFGDGKSATGDSATHTYRRTGGPRAVEVTATDAGGNSRTERHTIVVKDVTPVVISRARFTPKALAALGNRRAFASKLRRRSILRFRLTEPAGVRIALQRALPGRRKGKRCLPGRRAPKGKPCKRYARVPKTKALKRAGKAGANKVRFRGKVGRSILPPGRYRAELVATDTGGLRSKPAHAPFRIVSR